MKYLRIHNVSIHINFYQNQFINVLGRIFLNSSKDRRKDGVFVRCRRTYVFNNWLLCSAHKLPDFYCQMCETYMLFKREEFLNLNIYLSI